MYLRLERVRKGNNTPSGSAKSHCTFKVFTSLLLNPSENHRVQDTVDHIGLSISFLANSYKNPTQRFTTLISRYSLGPHHYLHHHVSEELIHCSYTTNHSLTYPIQKAGPSCVNRYGAVEERQCTPHQTLVNRYGSYDIWRLDGGARLYSHPTFDELKSCISTYMILSCRSKLLGYLTIPPWCTMENAAVARR